MNRADEIINRIKSNPDLADDGTLANDLLREFHRGAPVAKLRTLLLSENEKIIGVAAFVAEELGSQAHTLMPAMANLLKSDRNRFIRASAISCILVCATEANEMEIAKVVELLSDPDWPIRWKAMEFLSLASPDQLSAAVRFFQHTDPKIEHLAGLRLLLNREESVADEVISWLTSAKPLGRKYGVIAAARGFSTARAPLTKACSVGDDDVVRFAQSQLLCDGDEWRKSCT